MASMTCNIQRFIEGLYYWSVEASDTAVVWLDTTVVWLKKTRFKNSRFLRDVREVPNVVKGDLPEERLRQCGEW